MKLPAVNGYLSCARNTGKAYLSFLLAGIFCPHSDKYTTEYNLGIDHKPSDAKDLIINYDTQNIYEKNIPYLL